MVNNKTSESPGVRANALADLRIVSSPLENATVLILRKNLLRPPQSGQFPEQNLLSAFSFCCSLKANRDILLSNSFFKPCWMQAPPGLFKSGRHRP
jgi:hypothetical protein